MNLIQPFTNDPMNSNIHFKSLLAIAIFAFHGLTTQAQIPEGYKLETVELPKGAVTILGLCHKPDGTLAIVSWEGEVWERKNHVWTKFAENLMEPNGIYYDSKEKAYYVAQKPELTRLTDTNQDGICDRYECVTDAFGITGEYHDCLLYTSPSPRDQRGSRMPSSA